LYYGRAQIRRVEENTLRAIEIEDWARRIIDGVQRGTTIEDSRVEFKSEWPKDENKAARRIAGHCNANTGDHVLWLIGVDEKSGVVGVSSGDMATWWPSVKSEFDEQAPSVQEVALSVEGHTVVVLLFETDLAPFVVRNAVSIIQKSTIEWRVDDLSDGHLAVFT
jgi:hypothetical protein